MNSPSRIVLASLVTAFPDADWTMILRRFFVAGKALVTGWDQPDLLITPARTKLCLRLPARCKDRLTPTPTQDLMMTAYLIVRAEVDPTVKSQFDAWYQDEHLPDAHKVFGTITAKRGWSSVDPHVHVAFYEFPDLEAAHAILGSDIMKGLIKDFDARWDGKVVRSREIVAFSQTI